MLTQFQVARTGARASKHIIAMLLSLLRDSGVGVTEMALFRLDDLSFAFDGLEADGKLVLEEGLPDLGELSPHLF